MSVVGQNKFGFLVHPLSTSGGGELQLTEKPYGKPSSVSLCADRKKKKKKCRSTPLNHGEACLMAYHEIVREKILNGWKSLVNLGKEAKYFRSPEPMSLSDTSTIKLIDNDTLEVDKYDKDKNCLLQTACNTLSDKNSVNVDLVDMCNQALVSSDLPSMKLFVTIGHQHVQELDQVCGSIVHNFADHHVTIKHLKYHYYIPENSTFLLSDISQLHLLVEHAQDLKYDCIVIDPPWENRSAIRSHKYNWLSENDLLQIQLPHLCKENCLVVIWVTNKVKFSDFVREELFPCWSVELAGEWHWIKVTTNGEFVFDLDSPHKKPYELLLLGQYHDKTLQHQKPNSSPDDLTSAPKRLKLSSEETSTKDIPHDQVIISVPSCNHSQKPFLGNVLKSFLPDNAKCLELFARNLQPGWTSWGNEVLKFQIVNM